VLAPSITSPPGQHRVAAAMASRHRGPALGVPASGSLVF